MLRFSKYSEIIPFVRSARGMLFTGYQTELQVTGNPNPSIPINTQLPLAGGARAGMCIQADVFRAYLMRAGVFMTDGAKYVGGSLFNSALNSSADTRVNALAPAHTTALTSFETTYIPLKMDLQANILRKFVSDPPALMVLRDTRDVTATALGPLLTAYLQTDSSDLSQVGGNSYLTKFRNVVVCANNTLTLTSLPPYGSATLSINGAAAVTVNVDGNGDAIFDFGGAYFPCQLFCRVYNGPNATGTVVGQATILDACGGDTFAATRQTLPIVPFTPKSIQRLSLWLRPEALPAVPDGSAVNTWTDSSDTFRDATKMAAIAAPLLKTNAYNGRSVVRFDGTAKALTCGNIPALRAANFTIAIALQFAAGNPTPRGLFSIMTAADQGLNIDNGAAGTAEQLLTGDGVSGVSFATTYGAGALMHILIMEYNGLTSRFRTWLMTTAVPAVTLVIDQARDIKWPTATPPLSLGTYYNDGAAGAALYAGGDIGEVIMYDKVLRPADRASLASYLTARWL